jgi:hypothetical protein
LGDEPFLDDAFKIAASTSVEIVSIQVEEELELLMKAIVTTA